MIRSWMLAFLLVGIVCSVSEARGRGRVMQYPTRSFPSQSPMRYSTGTTQVASPQSQSNGSGVIQQVSYQNSVGNSGSHGGSMQAWAEEEARMMAARGTCGHIRSAPPGCFVGVGCGTTCMGSGTLVAEAHYQGKSVRVWRR